ncbi:MAG: protein translocase subunit SecD [Synechococcus sp.]|nr:protein translocase subunit SecD [Synechococcus sp.]
MTHPTHCARCVYCDPLCSLVCAVPIVCCVPCGLSVCLWSRRSLHDRIKCAAGLPSVTTQIQPEDHTVKNGKRRGSGGPQGASEAPGEGEVPANASEEEQLEALLIETERRITPLFGEPELTGSDLVDAGRQQQQGSQSWEVTLRFSQAGGEKFADLTKSIAGTNRLLGIMLDGRSISEASVGPQFATAGITGGAATITGRFSADEARDLEVQLRGGALPLPVEIIENRSVGPTLGAQNIRNSLIAAGSGTALVGVFMVIIYRLPGAVALLALLLYSLFNLALYALIPVTLTLPGIAGFILSVGMAVDANILIFERSKEELRDGNTLFRSVDTGFSRAFSSIFDGHLTTLISCAALGWLGSGLVRGFAVTLAIGVLLSLFTALTCTRTLMRLALSYPALRKPSLFLAASSQP